MKASFIFQNLLPRVVVAIILLQTLFFKFSGAEESVYIFTTVCMEPWGRLGSGAVEGIAAVLMLIGGRYVIFGAGLALGTMAGAIISHLTILGIEVMGDGGELFLLAIVVAKGSAWMLYQRREQVLGLLALITGKHKPATELK